MASTDMKKTPQKAKETAGLLMSIIRILSTSAGNVHQREKEKASLEKSYKESDRKLDKLLTEHLPDLNSILQAFSKISGNVTTSQEKIRAVKVNLQSCTNLLHCKRDELRKLWIEGIKHKTEAAMLDQIEQVKDVSHKLQQFTEKKHYLHATDLLVKSVSLLEGDLQDVEALRDVKVELIAKKEELFETLIDELHKQIYIKSTSAIVKGFQRQGSMRQSKREKTSLVKAVLTQSPVSETGYSKLNCLESVDLSEVAKPQQINEDLNIEPEDEPVHFIAILVECLTMLRRLPEAIDAMRTRIRPGLLNIVQRSSQQVADNAYFEGEDLGANNQPQYLLELLELILKQFKLVAHVHEIVLANLQRVKNSTSSLGDFCLYDTVEVWTKIQGVLQIILSDYLDIRNASGTQATTSFDEPTTDTFAYFSKKRPTKKKFALFRFDASSHAISMNSYLREQRQEFYGSGEILSGNDEISDASKNQFVCKPCASNITVIYNPLQKFIMDIEVASKMDPGTSTLQKFVKEFIEKIFLNQVLYNIQNSIDSATKGYEAQRIIVDLRTQRELGTPKPLLQSTVTVAHKLEELQGLMKDLPDYADQFLNMICKILLEYKTTCHSSYRECTKIRGSMFMQQDRDPRTAIVLSEAEEKRTISATWAKDEDINRFLRCLPNWQNLKADTDTAMQSHISEEDMRALNSKESSILTSNLSSTDALIPQQEIITDVIQLRTLGNLSESLEWFSGIIKELAKKFSIEKHKTPVTSPTTPEGAPPVVPLNVSDSTLESLRSLARDLEQLGELCLMVLHLEVRVHCFYHLMPIAIQANYACAIDDMDPDFNVIKLNKDLVAIEEAMTQSLQPKKFKYIFEGLGHLVGSILINSTHYLKKINENGIKKMCRNIFAVQQCLTNITMNRESDLDHARQYYELLYLGTDEILNHIVEHGAIFTEHEYTNLTSLSHRSERGSKEEELDARLTKLAEILTDIEANMENHINNHSDA